jgi:hypothetical protein
VHEEVEVHKIVLEEEGKPLRSKTSAEKGKNQKNVSVKKLSDVSGTKTKAGQRPRP